MTKFCRYFSIFLCVALLFVVGLSPIQAKAYYFANPGMSALFSMFWSSDLSTDTAEGLASVLQVIWDNLSAPVQSQLNYYVTSNQTSFTVTDGQAKIFLNAIKAVMVGGVINGYKIRHMFLDLGKDELTAEDVVSAETELIIPTEEQLKNFDLLSAQQLIVKQNTLLSSQNSILQDIYSSLESHFKSVSSWLSTINASIADLERDFEGWYYHIYGAIADLERDFEGWYYGLHSAISHFNDDVKTWLSTINASIADLERDLEGWLYTINSSISSVKKEIVKLSSNITSTLESTNSTVVEKLSSIEQQILIYPKYDDEKPQILVQISDQEQILVTDYASLSVAFEKKLAWIPQILDFLRELFSRIAYTGDPPKVSIPLSAASGSMKFSSDVYIMDMSWYEPYKSSCDKLISGFLWLSFGWIAYKRTPSIINGLGISQDRGASGSKKGDGSDV